MSTIDTIRERYRSFADKECRGYSDAYCRLALDVADDDEILRLIAEQPVIQPNLFFAAIQYLTGPENMPATGNMMKALLAHRGHEVAEIMQTRRTQTNEVGRCAVLLPALPPGPLALIEVGASAGLCLLLDRYWYDYRSLSAGDASSRVRLKCDITGNPPLPASLPEVVWRRGLDINPIDVHDDAAVQWLRACVWSDHAERRRRLDAAIQLAREDPPVVVKGDLIDDLPGLIDGAPTDANLVVFHSAVLAYLAADRREAFSDVLRRSSRRRDIFWISNEPPGVVGSFTVQPLTMPQLRFVLRRTRFRHGMGVDETLGLAHFHGLELTWL